MRDNGSTMVFIGEDACGAEKKPVTGQKTYDSLLQMISISERGSWTV
jgi:hypothetical protein